MTGYGLVFKQHGRIWLAIYEKDGDIQDAGTISDEQGIYDKLKVNEISFVKINSVDDAEFVCEIKYLQDLQTVTLENENYSDDKAIEMILKEGHFKEFAKEVWDAYQAKEK